MKGRAASASIVFGALWPLCAAIAGAPSCKSNDAPPAPERACGLTIWHKPATAAANVAFFGDFNGFAHPGVVPDAAPGGWRVAHLDLPPGEHLYAIDEDGVTVTDANVPTTGFHDGQEMTLAVVPDCTVPMLRVDGVTATPDGHATIDASFLAASSGAALDPATLSAAGLAVTSADPATGKVRLEASGLSRGKYIYPLHAKDTQGRDAEPAIATAWVEPTAWDPRDAIVYQIMIDRYRGDAGPLAPPATPAARAGGTLKGVHDALLVGDFDALGVNTLWLSPLYQNPDGEFPGNDGHLYTSYHGYWPSAGRALDPRLATDDELDAFMRDAHARGVRVLFDVVPNHVHQEHPWATEHPDWFNSDRDCVCGQGSCDWATHIETCWFASYLPDLDWTNPDVARAETDEVMWWFDRWGADGLRIDAVPMMPRAATRRIMAAVHDRYAHPGNEPYVLGENFTGPGGYDIIRYDLGPYGLDGSFNFPLMWTLRAAVGTESGGMSDLDASYRAGVAAWDGSGAVMGQMIGNHDVSRFASVSAGNDIGDTWTPAEQPLDPTVYAKQRLALGAVLTLPGAPVIYYGDEIGLAGKSDPDCRRVMPADAALLPEQLATRALVSKVAGARRCSDVLRRGDLTTLLADAERFVFARTLPSDAGGAGGAGGEMAIVALTRRPTVDVDVTLPPGAPPALFDVVTGARADVSSGSLHVASDAFGVHVYVADGTSCAR